MRQRCTAMVNRDRRGRRYIGEGHLDVGGDRGPGRLNVEGPGCARLEGSAEAVEGLGHVGAGTTLEPAVAEGDLRGNGRPGEGDVNGRSDVAISDDRNGPG